MATKLLNETTCSRSTYVLIHHDKMQQNNTFSFRKKQQQQQFHFTYLLFGDYLGFGAVNINLLKTAEGSIGL